MKKSGNGNLQHVLEEVLRDLYSAENQLFNSLPPMIKKAKSISLKQTLQKHLHETHRQAERLEQVAVLMGIAVEGNVCKGMKGLLEEVIEALKEDLDVDTNDLKLIAGVQKVECYRISSYRNASAVAKKLGLGNVVDLLQRTLEQENQVDQKLTDICENEILPRASASERSSKKQIDIILNEAGSICS